MDLFGGGTTKLPGVVARPRAEPSGARVGVGEQVADRQAEPVAQLVGNLVGDGDVPAAACVSD